MAKNSFAEHPRNLHPVPSILQTPILVFILTGTGIFAAETGLMLVLAIWHERLTVWQQALIDSLLLSMVVLPILYLVYLFTFRPMRRYNAELLQFAKELQEQIAERRVAEEALRQSEKQLRHVSAQLLTVQETERKQMAHELHEELAQSLVLVKMLLTRVGTAICQDHAAAQADFGLATKQIDDIIGHIRCLSLGLSPVILHDLGFSIAARRLVSNYAGDSGPKTTVAIDDDVDVLLNGPSGIHTYRILQEALENVRKHAQASHISVAIKGSERELLLEIEDDGKGFDCNREQNRGVGLAIMHARARLLNGSLDLRSEPGRGSSIRLKIPRRSLTCVDMADGQ